MMKQNLLIYSLLLLGVLITGSCNKDTGLPVLTTLTVKEITRTTAVSGGNISYCCGKITARGVCWSIEPNPTISDNKISNGQGAGYFTSKITGLIANTSYYLRSYATNNNGTGYGDQLIFSTIPFEVGQNFGGGIIFWLDSTGFHGLIASKYDITAPWGNYGNWIGGTSTAFGTGQTNTVKIANGSGWEGFAGNRCYDLELDGYDDWFLPSRDELALMYTNKNLIGGFTDNWYWSSSEYSSGSAWYLSFNGGNQSTRVKVNYYYVRAVRAF